MKEFDKIVEKTINKLANMESWDNVDWKDITNKVFIIPDAPNRYRGLRIKDRNDWLKFVCLYSMSKADNKFEFPVKQTKKEELNTVDILKDALREIRKEKVI